MARRAEKLKDVLPGLGQVLRYFWPYVRKERGLIAGSLIALLVGIVFRLLEPWPLKFVIDRIVPTEGTENWLTIPAIDALDSANLVVVAALAVVVITLARATADYTSKVGFFVIGNRAVIRVRDAVFRHLHSLSLLYYSKSRRGDLVIRLTRDVSLLRDVTATAVLPLVANVCVMVAMLGVLFWLQWQLAVIAMAIVPLFSLTTMRITRRIRKTAQKQREREGIMAAVASESLGAIEVVQTLSLEDHFAKDFSRRNSASQKEDLKANRLSARLARTVDVLLSIATALVLWYGARLVLRSQLSPGDLIVFLVYIKRIFKPAQSFAKYMARLAKATAAGVRVIDILEQPADVVDSPESVAAGALAGEIRFADVTFQYEPSHPVLKRIDFEVRAGQRVAIVGESGTGKSTLVNLVLRLYDPTQGSIFIDGRDIRQYTIKSLRSQISVVPQDSVLFSVSVRDNIAFGAPGSTQEQIEAAARLACAHEFIQEMSRGYDTVLGERGMTLSQGQRQRIAIARAALRDAPIMILDEPTSGLDEENERAVIDALENVTSGRTTFLITHNLRLASRADIVCYLEGGRLVEQGTHTHLLESNGKYAKLYRLQTIGNGKKPLESSLLAARYQ